METLTDFYVQHPLWVWMAIGAVLLAIEVSTDTGWLLWPAASAGVVALVTLLPFDLDFSGELVVFAALTVVSTLTAKKFLPQRVLNDGPDINDRTLSLVGKTGEITTPFSNGQGRVMVDGAEWAAEVAGGDAPAPGAKVEVVAVVGGARLSVRAV